MPDFGPPDLNPYDLAYGTNTDGAVACAPAGGGTTAKLVANTQTMPQSRMDYATDLNGDGKLDNQLGNIIGALTQQGLDSQSSVNMQVMNGNNLLLIALRSADPSFTTDGCAAATVAQAKPKASPKFDGTDVLVIDAMKMPGEFTGPIAAKQFHSEPPPSFAKIPSELEIQLPLVVVVPVHVIGARVQLTYNGGQLTGGQLNGAIRKVEIDTQVIPALAMQLSVLAIFNPQVAAIFDTGGAPDPACGNTCRNLDGSCAKADDNQIDDCEVATNAIIKNVLAPDVQMFDSAGNYHPSAANTNKDCLSIGIAFTAVSATF